ncbi:hypothetical protein [Yinghuangia soli]|uniref:PH domain-containing protein n=1 Tax=Yinghuangia soli TaxID=2908204 RepID=A0AA41Q786_9ACTN|nr:hypothetical protein [Yinghuangia soli]MCF2532235.1 hypothetical protein [Yinghuangia soli]
MLPETRIPHSPSQARTWLLTTLAAAAVLPPAVWLFDAEARMYVIAPLALLSVFYFCRPRVVLTDHAFTAKGFVRVSVPWDRIREVSVRRNKHSRTLVLVGTDGKEHKVPLPADGPGLADPEFDAKVRAITGYWEARRGWSDAAPEPGAPTAETARD